ncbi:hypothetical protein [Streptomyces himalayensis]|uniref:Uncharacterized protein n=1 Tax=Streptomyces himalayensis subsp. himalayensis TaxID=2756131 RepID=A0A7W0DH15_9ACTN|nr:hypothetical protein [Streptomyces himalayensis]MBA2944902.1 hypothetical protein [Streptomyces himalayensis subsp. himalayensis]
MSSRVVTDHAGSSKLIGEAAAGLADLGHCDLGKAWPQPPELAQICQSLSRATTKTALPLVHAPLKFEDPPCALAGAGASAPVLDSQRLLRL